MAKQQVYDASAIQALKGLEPVRRMPGMYTHTIHPLHIVQEAIDNAVDEALAGFGKRITVTVARTARSRSRTRAAASRWTCTRWRRSPRSRWRSPCCMRAASSRARATASYHISGGLHGVGVAVTNALSKRCEVTVYRDGEKHTIAFEGGELKQKLKSEKIKESGAPARSCALWPDPKYFDSPEHPARRARAPGALEGLPAAGPHDGARSRGQGGRRRWKYERGMAQYFDVMLDGRELVAPLFTGRAVSSTRRSEPSIRGDRAGRGRGLGDRLGRRRRHLRRQPRQPDPDALGRHARGRLPQRHLRCARGLHGHARASRPRA